MSTACATNHQDLKWSLLTTAVLGQALDFLPWMQLMYPVRQICRDWNTASWRCTSWKQGIKLCLCPECADYAPSPIEF